MRMLMFPTFLFCLMLLFCLPALCSTPPADSATTIAIANMNKMITSLKVRDFQKITGKKMSLKQKISFGVLKHKLKKESGSSKDGQKSLIFAITGAVLLIVGLFVPFVILAALAAAIVAVVVGSSAQRKNPDDRQAYSGTLLGWITLGLIGALFIAAIIFAIAYAG
jgi:uncharacterized membrane protein YphA (DoxX/SURF4 family)